MIYVVQKQKEAGTIWKEGAILIRGKVYKYQAKVYEEGSEYGIEGGRVSKVMIKHDGEIVVNYDRGWDVEPESEGAELALAIILKENN